MLQDSPDCMDTVQTVAVVAVTVLGQSGVKHSVHIYVFISTAERTSDLTIIICVNRGIQTLYEVQGPSARSQKRRRLAL
jgi:hypothetical protein